MTKLTLERINFIEHLHEVFHAKKGYGAFAFISVPEVISLFEKYLESNESADSFINRFIRSL